MYVILLLDLNTRIQEPRESREEDFAMALLDSGLVVMTECFMTRRRYIGGGKLDVVDEARGQTSDSEGRPNYYIGQL